MSITDNMRRPGGDARVLHVDLYSHQCPGVTCTSVLQDVTFGETGRGTRDHCGFLQLQRTC